MDPYQRVAYISISAKLAEQKGHRSWVTRYPEVGATWGRRRGPEVRI
jgi:hypothetical protein